MKDISCARAKELMSDYVDGLLDEQDQEAFQAHIAECPACSEELAQLSFLVGSLRAIPQVPVPGRFETQMHIALQQEIETEKQDVKPAGRVSRKRWRAMSAAAAVLLVGVLSFAMFEDDLPYQFMDFARNTEQEADGQDSSASFKAEKDAADAENDDDLADVSFDADSGAPVDAPQDAGGSQTGRGSDGMTAGSGAAKAENGVEERKSQISGRAESGAETDNRIMLASELDGAAVSTAGGIPETDTESDEAVDPQMKRAAGAPAVTSSDGALSRGGSSHLSAQKFSAEAQGWMDSFAEAVSKKDGALFLDTVAKVGINGYTTSTADPVLQFYRDYLGEGEISIRLIAEDSQKMKNVYLAEGSKNSTTFTISDTLSGLRAKSTILNHGLWLVQNAPSSEYALNSIQVKNKGKEIRFRFTAVDPAQDTADAAADMETAQPEEKEIVWKKTE